MQTTGVPNNDGRAKVKLLQLDKLAEAKITKNFVLATLTGWISASPQPSGLLLPRNLSRFARLEQRSNVFADAKITKNFVFGDPNGMDSGFASTLRAAPASQSVSLRSTRTAFECFR
jgi:hypothetical protein